MARYNQKKPGVKRRVSNIRLDPEGIESVGRGRFIMDIHIGDKLKMKKPHPCGSQEWEVLRVGIDFRLKCCGCGHLIMIPRKQAEKNVKLIIPKEEPGEGL